MSVPIICVWIIWFRKPVARLISNDIRIEFKELNMDEADDVEIGPGILLVRKAELEEKFVIEESSDDEKEEST